MKDNLQAKALYIDRMMSPTDWNRVITAIKMKQDNELKVVDFSERLQRKR
jgi:hypothetical protein